MLLDFARTSSDGLLTVAGSSGRGELAGPIGEYLVAIRITPGAFALERDHVHAHLVDVGALSNVTTWRSKDGRVVDLGSRARRSR
jgi:hypothetical protein